MRPYSNVLRRYSDDSVYTGCGLLQRRLMPTLPCARLAMGSNGGSSSDVNQGGRQRGTVSREKIGLSVKGG